ncbi:ABC transporter permease [Nocardia flavorosea]|uniref:ABC transporter permease n=1 Tax=Nocardia flavorosea TaxID=53429 RepID=A0A846YMZ5_9NOCA|nr:ABC transporter permease [Nocardia flavorosea]NKY59101.1 ABC transporter permease [Nocardia flavorosea]
MMFSIVRRLGRGLLVVLLVTLAVVVLLSFAPGSVAEAILGDAATPEAVAALNSKLGLDEPLWMQYLNWIANAAQGDLGTSPLTGQSVTTAITERLPVTFQLAAMSLVIALVSAVFLAVISVMRPGSPVDRGTAALSSVFLSVPAFVAGPVLIYFFAVELGWAPVAGWNRIGDGIGLNLQSALLPAIAMSLMEIAAFHRLLRTDLMTTLREDFIGAARAKGMNEWYVMFRHALRPSSFSLITLAGINLGRLIGGTVIVETLFSLPGLGQLLASSIVSRDLIMVQGIVAFMAVVYVVINILVDSSYELIDPRVRKVATV